MTALRGSRGRFVEDGWKSNIFIRGLLSPLTPRCGPWLVRGPSVRGVGGAPWLAGGSSPSCLDWPHGVSASCHKLPANCTRKLVAKCTTFFSFFLFFINGSNYISDQARTSDEIEKHSSSSEWKIGKLDRVKRVDVDESGGGWLNILPDERTRFKWLSGSFWYQLFIYYFLKGCL